ncbi:hypothetical protein PPL_04110 [Heterostelium album PN500]|uniref:Uncharacterized protein n=1 Tax=Heterostelium pallidum (strain ATCC 26659 / Pp 5 / PN500) TaxID=670386 RepID=D3B621_HETP5|nr:hypothetical protein PPL_04110 [Heterostelium album PN500]EFA83319.1 hypothetical protein PPL_04110 [Heterostelium album PN500]|eukprot:XP_020435436.1 hypothetical protein PPL_04110 [Heterostelium album PN500]
MAIDNGWDTGCGKPDSIKILKGFQSAIFFKSMKCKDRRGVKQPFSVKIHYEEMSDSEIEEDSNKV